MMASVAEYAAVAGISERAARLRAEQGRIDASRVGRIWLIPEHELGAAVEGKEPPGRPVSPEAFERLAQFLDGDHAHLSPDQRRQARRLAARLLPEDNARALRALGRRRGGVPHPFRASQADVDALRQDPALQPAGICDHRQQQLSSHGLVEAYVRPGAVRRLRALYGLSPVQGPQWNVLLRAIDRLPPPSRLRMAADLLDAGDLRSATEASRVVRGLAEAAL